MSAAERAVLPASELVKVQAIELNAVTMTYMAVGLVMVGLLLAFYFTRMPYLKEDDKKLDFAGTFKRLLKNKNYVWAVVAQFFYVGAQIAVWSFIIRYVMQQLHLDARIADLGNGATSAQIIEKLRNVEPVAAGFYNIAEKLGFTSLLPNTPEQAGATYYILSLILFVIARFGCTWLMKYITPRHLLTALSLIAVVCCLITIYGGGFTGVYALVFISACMSLMFPTIYGMGITGLGEDTKIGGAGMVMAIAGAAVLTQIQGIVSDEAGSIELAYWIPALAFMVVAYYSAFVSHRHLPEAVKINLQR
jgi:FHS family L-fucose permease-like MFS transporter